jgi:hypothetical protein
MVQAARAVVQEVQVLAADMLVRAVVRVDIWKNS